MPVRSGSLAALSGRFLLQLAAEVKCSVLDNVREVTVVDYGTAFDPRREHAVRARLQVSKKIAREIMQLFTLGNEKLNADGRFALVNCSTVSAYRSHGSGTAGSEENTEMQ